MSFLSIASLCDQRKRQQQFNYLNLPSRIESQTDSPYLTGNVTKLQLDMRRKAEVLQYNQGNTKANQMTKKQKFALLMNGKAQKVSKSYIIANTDISNAQGVVLTCNNQNLPITTPSSACGVPYDYINNVNTLYLDPNVSLYNYINPVLTRSYGFINPPSNANLILYSNYTNVITTTSSKISVLEFSDIIENPTYTLTISNIPLALYIYGDISYGDISGSMINTTIDNIYISPNPLKPIQLNVLYNNQIVSSNSIFNYQYSFDLSTNYTVDISLNVRKNRPTFSGSVFIGYINISNIVLYASPGYVYDFQLIIPVKYPSTYKIINTKHAIRNVNAYVVANVTADYLFNNIANNCNIINTLPTPNTLGTFTITAV